MSDDRSAADLSLARLRAWPVDATGIVPDWVLAAWAADALAEQRRRLKHVPRHHTPLDRWPVLRLAEVVP